MTSSIVYMVAAYIVLRCLEISSRSKEHYETPAYQTMVQVASWLVIAVVVIVIFGVVTNNARVG
jgi:hypothetical protein